MLAITVRFSIHSGFEEAFFVRVLQQAGDTLANEPKCHLFDVCRSEMSSGEILLYELYDDGDAFSYHLKTSHFLAFDKETRDWVAAKVVERWVKS